MGKRGPKKGAPNAGRPLETPIENRPDIIRDICYRTSSSNKSLVNILKQEQHFPDYTTFYKWLENDKNLAEYYARAKADQSDFLVDEALDIADNAKDYNKARLQVDTRKWIASKLKAKKYGDKIQADVDTSLTVKLVQFGGKKDEME